MAGFLKILGGTKFRVIKSAGAQEYRKIPATLPHYKFSRLPQQ
ncbi:MAG: hypothetical protein Q8K57_12150 [Thiobacillus sp.]|nr:hypothetical protein [Rhodocyclaceae bacterium]MDP1925521.1 hypothetical protein [Thiobacillus sp.]